MNQTGAIHFHWELAQTWYGKTAVNATQ